MARKLSKAMQSTTTLTSAGEVETPDDVRPEASTPRAFAEGAVVAGRYRVERFIARGGMGEVYAVEDQSLHEPVALKTIRPELASTPAALQRFKRELLLARRVTHPHVCRVFDIGEHSVRSEAGVSSKTVFLTMELLAGHTLHEQLTLHGRMSPEQVLPLAEQMAAALDAAHAAQIIHRDFKPGNVMLVPSPSVPGGQRAVVTDFGLASGDARDGEGTASLDGLLVGSPSYMAPEQVEGLPLSPACDLYAFGVVLFEMLTGRRPFVGDTPMATAMLRLREPPPSPRELVPELPVAWERMLLRCLERQPGARFASASEALSTLRGGAPGPTSTVSAPVSARRWGRRRTAAPPASMTGAPPVPRPVSRHVVAVIAPRNLMARAGSEWLSTALAELLSAELAMGEQLRVLSGEGVAQMRGDLALPDEEGFAAGTLRRMRAHSGVDLVLTGAYLVQGREDSALLRLNLRLQEATTGETLAHLTELGPEQELLALVSRVGTALRQRLELEPLTTEQARGVRNAMPARPELARLYAEGLAALRRHDAASAVECFERVVEREPSFAPAHSALAAAFQSLYQEEAAKESARRAFELAGSLSREERLLVSARHHEAQAEWARAIEAYRTLFEFFPDHVEYGTALVYAQVSAGQNREAQATLESLRRLPAPLGEDARIDLAAAVATSATADFISSRRHAGAAVARARQGGQGQLAASALIMEAYAARNLGEPLCAVELLEESEQLFLAGGDRGGAARSMLVHAMALIDTGRLLEAERVFVSAIQAAREIRGTSLEAEALLCAGGLSCHLGDLSEGLRRARRAVELFRSRGRLSDMNSSTILMGSVRRLMGELDEARRLLEEGSHSAEVLFEDGYSEAWARYELGLLLTDLGERVQARQQLERALELRRARGLGAFVAETELALASLCLEEGRPREALGGAESALAAYAALKSQDREGLAYTVKARALLALGDEAGAGEAMERARALASQSEYVLIAAEVRLTDALRVRGDGGPSGRETVRQLQALAGRAAREGLKRVELEARLLRVELDPEMNEAVVAKELRSLRREANQLGYRGLLARANALKTPGGASRA